MAFKDFVKTVAREVKDTWRDFARDMAGNPTPLIVASILYPSLFGAIGLTTGGLGWGLALMAAPVVAVAGWVTAGGVGDGIGRWKLENTQENAVFANFETGAAKMPASCCADFNASTASPAPAVAVSRQLAQAARPGL